MPTKQQILEYWVPLLVNEKFWLDGFYDDKEEAEHICFACGSEVGTQRAHIVPKNQGGSDSVDNIHNLCMECHLESESLIGVNYDEWFKFKCPQNSGSYLRIMNKALLIAKSIENGNPISIPRTDG